MRPNEWQRKLAPMTPTQFRQTMLSPPVKPWLDRDSKITQWSLTRLQALVLLRSQKDKRIFMDEWTSDLQKLGLFRYIHLKYVMRSPNFLYLLQQLTVQTGNAK